MEEKGQTHVLFAASVKHDQDPTAASEATGHDKDDNGGVVCNVGRASFGVGLNLSIQLRGGHSGVTNEEQQQAILICLQHLAVTAEPRIGTMEKLGDLYGKLDGTATT
jgi:hypothetical protein